MTARMRLSELAIGMIPILLLLLLWHYLTVFKIAPPTLLPPPGVVFARFVQLLGDPNFLGHAATTLYRLFWGFGLAVVVGVGLGIGARTGAGRRIGGAGRLLVAAAGRAHVAVAALRSAGPGRVRRGVRRRCGHHERR